MRACTEGESSRRFSCRVVRPAPAGSSPYTDELFRQATLRFLAHETGGRPMLFDERTRILETVVEDTRSYYSLGFTTDLRGDGTYRRALYDTVSGQVRNRVVEVEP